MCLAQVTFEKATFEIHCISALSLLSLAMSNSFRPKLQIVRPLFFNSRASVYLPKLQIVRLLFCNSRVSIYLPKLRSDHCFAISESQFLKYSIYSLKSRDSESRTVLFWVKVGKKNFSEAPFDYK